MERALRVLKIAGVFAGVIIGAGFASGKEIMEFFISYGADWGKGILLMGVLFAIFGAMLLTLLFRYQPESYQAFLTLLAGRQLGNLIEWISGIFLCVLFFTMAAASGAVVQEVLGVAPGVGTVFLLIFCFLVFLCGTKGVVLVNAVLAPLLMVCGIFVGAYVCLMQVQNAGAFSILGKSRGFAFSALLYVSYNMITAVAVLLPMQGYLKDKRTGIYAGILGGLSMGLLGAALGGVLYLNREGAAGLSIPMLSILQTYQPVIRGMYLFMLAAAILTTAVGNGFGALCWLSEKSSLPGPVLNLLLMAFAFLMSGIGFDGFVGRVYPFFGYLGLLQIVYIIWLFFFGRKKQSPGA